MKFSAAFLCVCLAAVSANPTPAPSPSRPTLVSNNWVRSEVHYDENGKTGYWDLTTNNFPVPANETTLWGWVVKVPLDSEVHATGFEPVITEGHDELVHHVAVFQCRDLPEETMQQLTEDKVGTQNWFDYKPHPDPIKYCDAFYMVFNWGAQAYHFPEHVGVPLNKDKDNRYFLLQMHYENVHGSSNIKDSSGMRMFFTKEKRQYEGQTQVIGASVGQNLVIPPKQERFTVRGMCSPHCYQDQIPKDGIKIFAAVFHAHSTGRQLIGRHFRGDKELKPWLLDIKYDSRHQIMKSLPQEHVVLPGDLLSVECTYETTSKTNATLGGLASREEMCRIFFMFYPKLARPIPCESSNSLPDTLSAVGVEELYPNSTTIKKPAELEGRPLWEYLLNKSQWTKDEVKQLQSMHMRNPQHGFCWIGMDEAFRKPQYDRDAPELVRYPVAHEERIYPEGLYKPL